MTLMAPTRDVIAPPTLDEIDKALLTVLQQAFPIQRYPWTRVGDSVGVTGREALKRAARLKAAGLIRQISPIYDSRALGYTSVLVAARVGEQRIEQAARIVSAHPGVSHNYQRDAEFNLWFTLAVPPGQQLDDHLAQLSRRARLEAAHPMPALRTFHIGVVLDVTEGHNGSRRQSVTAPDRSPINLTERDKAIIRVTQNDLPLRVRPFDDACRDLCMQFNDLKAWFERMQEAGALRRIAAILRHRSMGFVANGMGVWQVDEDKIEQAGRMAAQFSQVSHCYQRPSYPDWPFNLYTMIHARTIEQCEAAIERLAQELAGLGVRDHRVIYSTREFKKQRVRYFE